MPLNREQVLAEAMRLVDDDGLDALSLRTLASRLGVQAPTLYWHVKNKAALLDALADAIMDEALAAVPEPAPGGEPSDGDGPAGGRGAADGGRAAGGGGPAGGGGAAGGGRAAGGEGAAGRDGREWLLAALGQLRAALLRHRDGARIVSGARYSMRRGDFSERAMATLVDHGVDLHRARLLVLAGERYTVGWVLEEQAPVPDEPEIDVEALRARFPVATRAITEYFVPGRTADDLYFDIARLILDLPASPG